jgi:class 3 adenylate cyclase
MANTGPSTSGASADAASARTVPPDGDQLAAPDRDEERARIADLLESHAPPDWEERFRKNELLDAIIDHEPIQMFVMAADIRSSTILMKEAVRFERFAFIMDKFVTAVRRGIRRSGGWFDKFTGDGFLAYWIVQSGPDDDYHEHFVQAAGNIVHTAHTLVDFFHRLVLEDFRNNSRNLPQGVGLSMGLDAGPGYLVQIAGELTVVGSPVVGAVRMVTAAEQPREIIANVFLGERIREEQEGVYEELGVTVTREYRPTKEYPRGQEVYALTFDQEAGTDPEPSSDQSDQDGEEADPS